MIKAIVIRIWCNSAFDHLVLVELLDGQRIKIIDEHNPFKDNLIEGDIVSIEKKRSSYFGREYFHIVDIIRPYIRFEDLREHLK